MSGKIEVERELVYLSNSLYEWFISSRIEMSIFLKVQEEIDRYLSLISKGVPPDATIQFFREYEVLSNQESIEKYYVVWEN